MKKKRALIRARKRRMDTATEDLLNQYRDARRELRKLIKNAKQHSWNELIKTTEDDPWGLPYKIVLNKLRLAAQGLSEELDGAELEKMLASLFPTGEVHDPYAEWVGREIPEGFAGVSSAEVEAALRRGNAGKAPGPDGITLAILKQSPPILVGYIADTFSTCLREGIFPSEWKRARLVLIPKGSTGTTDREIRARPICLINEIGKLFERVLAEMINQFIEDSLLNVPSPRQFGFRKGKSTIDALDAAGTIYYWLKKRYLAIAVGLDVTNAFNSIPWPAIKNALRTKSFPLYTKDY